MREWRLYEYGALEGAIEELEKENNPIKEDELRYLKSQRSKLHTVNLIDRLIRELKVKNRYLMKIETENGETKYNFYFKNDMKYNKKTLQRIICNNNISYIKDKYPNIHFGFYNDSDRMLLQIPQSVIANDSDIMDIINNNFQSKTTFNKK